MSASQKTCSKCCIALPVTSFRLRKRKSGNGEYVNPACRSCEAALQRDYRSAHLHDCKNAVAKWKRENKERHSAHSRKSYFNNWEKRRLNAEQWKSKNRDKWLFLCRCAYEKERDYLHPSYIRSTLKINKTFSADSEGMNRLINDKREQLFIYRLKQKIKTALLSHI